MRGERDRDKARPEGRRGPQAAAGRSSAQGLGNAALQRLLGVGESEEAIVDESVARAIETKRGGGHTLDSAARTHFEAALSHDFSDVRVHTDTEADALSRSLAAEAFTTGSDIFFRAGTYAPLSAAGRKLLAHELTHVVQQRGAPTTGDLTVTDPGDPSEREAEAVAEEVGRAPVDGAASGAARQRASVGRSVQRHVAGGRKGDEVVDRGGARYTITGFNSVHDPLLAGGGGAVKLYELKGADGTTQLVLGDTTEFSLASPEMSAAAVAKRQLAGGLAAAGPAEKFAQAAVEFRRKTPDASFEEFARFLHRWSVTILALMESYPPELSFRDSGALGVFNRKSWTININRNGDEGKLAGKTMRDLSDEEVADAADTIYHESRHSEQFFRIARMLAASGSSVDEIASSMTIPRRVGESAHGRPLRSSRLESEAGAWHRITLGPYRSYKEGIQDLSQPADRVLAAAGQALGQRDRAGERIPEIQEALLEMSGGIAKLKATRTLADSDEAPAIKAHAEAIVRKYNTLFSEVVKPIDKIDLADLATLAVELHDARMGAYKAFAHEADAYRVGGMVKAAVVRQLGTT